jgi:hypothetical protein
MNKNIYLTVLFGFLFSLAISFYNIHNFDKNITTKNRVYHKMIKTDPYRYLSHGYEIKKQLENGINFFETGRENYTKYLPPRLAALYYYFFDIEFTNTEIDESIIDQSVKIGVHDIYLYIQCLIYYLSVFYLSINILKHFKKKVTFFVIFFLSFEPTVFQYHGTFWSESIFFSIQILIISLIFNEEKKFYHYCIMGLFLALLSFQKQLAFFYIIPLVVFYYFFERKNLKKLIFLVIPIFLIIQLVLGLNNYLRSGKFYLMTSDTKVEMHRNLVVKVMSKKMNMSIYEFKEYEGAFVHEFIKKKNFEIDYSSKNLKKRLGFMSYRNSVVKEKDRFYVDKFIRERTIKYIANNPLDFFKHAVRSSIHLTLLNPFHIYSEHNFESSEKYYKSNKHNELIIYRIVYSLVIYFLALIGFLELLKKGEYRIIFFLGISFLYYFATIFWHGNTRYFVPAFLYLLFLTANGTSVVFSKFFLKKN